MLRSILCHIPVNFSSHIAIENVDDDDDNTGVIIGAVVGGTLLLILVVLVLFIITYVLFHHRTHGKIFNCPEIYLHIEQSVNCTHIV